MGFIPDSPKSLEQIVPYFEDITAKDVPGRWTEKSLDRIQQEITDLLVRMGAFGVTFVMGKFEGYPLRYGFAIHFRLNGIPGRIDCAALPMRFEETKKKKDRALAQALYLLRNMLEAQLHSSVYQPGVIPLVPYLLGDNGRTVTEALVEAHELATLTPRGYLPGAN